MKRNKNILIALGSNLCLILLAIFVFGTRYTTDDDIAMARIAYGLFFEPQTRLVFTCNAFGTLLKGLSSLIDGVNWQLFLYYGSLMYGGVVSLCYVLKKQKSLLTVLWFFVVIAFYYSTYININFSIVTSMLAFFGYITLFIGAYNKDKIPVLLSIVTLIFAMIIRYESFFAFSLFVVFAFGLIFIKDVREEGIKHAVFRYIIPFAVALSIPVLLVIVDRLSYNNETWSNYLEYNDNRSQILDFQSVLKHENQQYFENLGLSEEMVESLKNWQFNDTEIFSEQLIIKMGNDSKGYNPKLSLDFIFEALGYSIEKICKQYYFSFGVLFLALLTIRKNAKQKGGVCVFATPWLLIIPLILEIGFYDFMNRGIDRVFRTTGLGFWCGLVALLCCGYFENMEESLLDRRWISIVSLALMTISLCLQIDDLKSIERFHLVDRNAVEEEWSFLNDGRIYMCDIDTIREIEDSYGVWQTPKKGSLYNCIELGGWMVNYPTVKEKQENLGVSNPYKSLAYNDNVYLITTDDGNIQLDFLKSAYDENIESNLIEKHGDLSVYKYSVK